MPLAVTLDDKYLLESGRVYLTGTQALVRLPMMQRQRDLAAGLNTGWLHLGLSRLAAGRLRPGAVAGQALHQAEPHRVPARRQRGPRGHRPVGHPADPPLSRRALRRRVRHVVRQGPGRRPLGRRAEARQLCRHVQAWRHRGAGRRRPHGQVVDDGPPERARLHGGRHPGDPCRQRAGVSRFRPARLRDVALLGPVGRLQGAERDRRFLGLGPCRSAPHRDSARRPISSCRPTACISAGPTTGWARNAASSRSSSRPRWPTGAPTSSTG